VTHSYDLTTPRNSPAQFLVPLAGPWLYPAMTEARIPDSEWNKVSDYLLDQLNRRLLSMQAKLPNFHVAQTQGTLNRAASGAIGASNDWDNEIHPRRRGYAKLAKVVTPIIEDLTL
jgi:hypothetical protein